MKQINEFISHFGACISLDESLVVKRQNRCFLLNENLKKLVMKDFFYAGIYLGKVKNGKFFPSFCLLKMIAKKRVNKIVVDKKTEWLFICGRDIFKRGITEVIGSKKKSDYALILNMHGECLGFGRILRRLDKIRSGVVVKNISDIGDFLRRER